KGARGVDGREYPWGGTSWLDGWDATRCRNRWNGYDEKQSTADVFAFPRGRSPWGLYGMAGNVSEWTADHYDANAYLRYSTGDYSPPPHSGTRAVRGGAWGYGAEYDYRCSRRKAGPASSSSVVGFRCAMDPPSDQAQGR
ncbi:MAG: SUMF1/EgtB/PvdO family nonheme iron enzyme, partial [Armatimonadia bacterium]|nr:SUMF1/EgtB/PvdO family nonheme iron enzyme [Armatimonadia bacterium]